MPQVETMNLTQKQIGFTQDYFNEIPSFQAYMNHYNVKSRAVADVCASQALRNPKIQAYLQELREKAESDAVMSRQEILETHTEIARGRIGNLLDENQRIKQGTDLSNASIQEIDTTDIKIGKGENSRLAKVTKIKLHDPVRSMQEIAKLQGHYPKEEAGGNTYNDIKVLIVREKPKEIEDATE